MISTTQLRIQRTFLSTTPANTSARLARTFNAPTRRINHQPRSFAARSLSTTPPTTARQQAPSAPETQPSNPHTTTTSATTPILSTAAANPPPTTRPPPLDLPKRDPNTSTLPHLFATGKAYLTFYKTGLRHIYINTRLVWSLNTASGIPPDHTPPGDTASPPTKTAAATTRSTELLRRRWAHDVRRLPVFALMLLVCGEFTPLVVLAVPGVVPITCRIPQQVEKLRRKAEDRRGASFERLGQRYGEEIYREGEAGEQAGAAVAASGGERRSQGPAEGGGAAGAAARSAQQACLGLSPGDVTAHVARSLNLISSIWDALPLSLLPDSFVSVIASRKVRKHLAYLDQDNHFIAQAGGVDALEEEEVLLACEDRGFWPVEGADKDNGGGGGGGGGGGLLSSARENLRRWLYLVGDDHGRVADRDDPWSAERASEREARMVVLMMRKEWPRQQVTVRTSALALQGNNQ
ncbi:hypothetical protein VM1G_11806 [Cytospora mali]|uniref:Letm1 RBD domain-containing protein n=1 Tax=Cytospora mali TaxID=578113 RepID=A0A194W758_CYTMA|nr:hypothetical protein VM1G_11806 [Valsa mali]